METDATKFLCMKHALTPRHQGWIVIVNEKLQLPNVYIRHLTDVRKQHPALKNSARGGKAIAAKPLGVK